MDKFSSGPRNYNPIKTLGIYLTGVVTGNAIVDLTSDKRNVLRESSRKNVYINTSIGDSFLLSLLLL